MKVYFIRHGESTGNVVSRHQNAETPLSPSGIKQAHFVALRFKKIPIDIIISSDFSRAYQTAQIIAQKIESPLIIDKLLREIKRPTEVEGKLTTDPIVFSIKEKIAEHIEDKNWHYADEENYYDLQKRAAKIVTFLEKRTEKNILVVTHGAIITMIILRMIFKDKENYHLNKALSSFLCLENTGITLCEFNDKKWKLKTWNDYAHLG